MASETEMVRDNTMEATAKEGIKFLEKADPKLAEQCKAAVKEATKNGEEVPNNGADVPANGAGDAPESNENGNSPSKITRDNTMVTTAEAGKEFLERQGGVNEEAKTRAQEAELNKAEKEEEDKTATKRAADDAPEQEVDEAKKAKTEEETEKAAEESAEAAPEEAKAAE